MGVYSYILINITLINAFYYFKSNNTSDERFYFWFYGFFWKDDNPCYSPFLSQLDFNLTFWDLENRSIRKCLNNKDYSYPNCKSLWATWIWTDDLILPDMFLLVLLFVLFIIPHFFWFIFFGHKKRISSLSLEILNRWAILDLNQGPRDYESPALTAELMARNVL